MAGRDSAGVSFSETDEAGPSKSHGVETAGTGLSYVYPFRWVGGT